MSSRSSGRPSIALWTATQQPEHHQRWDVRFGRITYLDHVDGEAQQFTYATTVAPGVTIAGTGEVTRGPITSGRNPMVGAQVLGRRPPFHHQVGRRLLAIHPDRRRCPVPHPIRLPTAVGPVRRRIDKAMFRPLFGWATAWSFDRLRLWLEDDIPPEQSRDRADHPRDRRRRTRGCLRLPRLGPQALEGRQRRGRRSGTTSASPRTSPVTSSARSASSRPDSPSRPPCVPTGDGRSSSRSPRCRHSRSVRPRPIARSSPRPSTRPRSESPSSPSAASRSPPGPAVRADGAPDDTLRTANPMSENSHDLDLPRSTRRRLRPPAPSRCNGDSGSHRSTRPARSVAA